MSAKDDGSRDLRSMVRSKRRLNKKKARASIQTESDELDRKSEPRLKSKSNRMRDILSTSQNQELSEAVDAQQTTKSDHKRLQQATHHHDAADDSSVNHSRVAETKSHNSDELRKSQNEAAHSGLTYQSASPDDLGDIDLEEIDLRSPLPSSDEDPDYDFINVSEATHSTRNAQPDRADKYPDLQTRPKQRTKEVDSEQTFSGNGHGKSSSSEAGKWRRMWPF